MARMSDRVMTVLPMPWEGSKEQGKDAYARYRYTDTES